MPHLKLSPLLGGHLALDFLNTLARSGGSDVEFLADDRDVVGWLARAGLAPAAVKSPRGTLLRAARELREAGRLLIASRKEGKRDDPARLNRFLAAGSSYRQLEWRSASGPREVRHRHAATPEALLAPVAEAVADLLLHGDFEQVRKCENANCILWFYDRTRSHRRRWCSTATCGNRFKVAAFRQRQRRRRPSIDA